MNQFRIGQRVRINCPTSPRHGLCGTIADIVPNTSIAHAGAVVSGVTAHRLDIDGIGRVGFCADFGVVLPFAYEAHELIPLDDDSRQLSTWDNEAFKLIGWRPAPIEALGEGRGM